MVSERAIEILTAKVSEDELKSTIIHAATTFGWHVHHDRPARTGKDGEWRTHIQGDAGFPDLTLAREGRVIFAELKRANGRVSEAQHAWLEALGRPGGTPSQQAVDPKANPEVYVWRPIDLPEIMEILR
jgi:hypothetical protein